MAKAKDNKSNINNDKELNALDKVAKNILYSSNPNIEIQDNITKRGEKFQGIIRKELDLAKGVSGGSIIDFMSTVRQQNTINKPTPQSQETDLTSMLMTNAGDIFGFFKDLYRNKYIEMQDLEFLTKFIPSLGEAVETTLDHITSSDDTSEILKRTLNVDTSITDDRKSQIIDTVTKIEKNLKLLKKLKNIVFKNTLVSGSYYVYAIGYKELYEQYQDSLNNKSKFNPSSAFRKVTESAVHVENGVSMESFTIDVEPIIESVNVIGGKSKIGDASFKKYLENSAPSINFINSDVLYEAMDEYAVLEAASSHSDVIQQNLFSYNKSPSAYADGVYDATRIGSGSGKRNEKFTQTGTYLKFFGSRNVVPVRIMDEVVGYYIIKTEKKKTTTSTFSTPGFFNNISLNENKKDELIDKISTVVCNQIMAHFSDKFINSNPQFKKLIGDCIMHNGFLDNDYRIQFIPAKYMVEFKILPDENDIGTSILKGALFPAKLLSSLIICMMLNYFNKSGNKTIAHVYKGPIGRGDTTNQVQRVIRNIQESNITFSDLLTNNMVFSKFTRDSNIALPTAPNGSKLVEFETMEGQNIDMSTEFINKLEDMAIMGTGVPITLLEAKGNTDFARSITSSNLKFARRVSNLQGDLEDSVTELYKILIRNSELDEELKNDAETYFSFKLPRPKILNNTNSMDYISNIQQLVDTVANIYYGDDSDPLITKKKAMFKSQYILTEASYIDWSLVTDIDRKISIELAKQANLEEASVDDNAGSMGDSDY